ncbi:monovalent cation/H(+) antiporter subunit G [Serpentinicella alkaliphila]|uniref:Multisubunit sodium/proton antiporter MrpG subunit n=1 Tax=Serpentinicella alkaliphila TaxID=1734049 RepID=A0A4R2U8Q5_9FIRM|nr:monovalent cation/H(+) antiporter subunit G [Serpentinicella alkaliphila]QUH25650.1 monovalent cation/H(+) antiporter subunit G [Serpentinicella alkaliphila]TCQ06639.1 multisubunit sodium/proton antiporter MrpG subunit [Serpentinicella alkaliphila]
MDAFKDIIIVILVLGGLFFFLVGTIGLLRMPDVFCRMHATAKSDTLGLGLILLALAIHHGISLISIKLFIIITFIWLTNPTASHIIAKSEWNGKE